MEQPLRIQKIDYELSDEIDIRGRSVDGSVRRKIRRLDELPQDEESKPAICQSNAKPVDSDFSQAIVHLHQPAVLYFVKLGKFSHQKVMRIRMRSGMGGSGLLIFDHKVPTTDALPQKHQLRHCKDGEQIVSNVLTFEYKKMDDRCFKGRTRFRGPANLFSFSFEPIAFEAVDLEFFGLQNEQLIGEALQRIKLDREMLSLRLCMKTLRDLNQWDIVQRLERMTNVRLEHPILGQLYQSLLVRTDYCLAERLIKRAAKLNLFDEYVQSKMEGRIQWNQLIGGISPRARINPQMCFDQENQIIYLFGGSSGVSKHSDLKLDDLWCFHVPTRQWRMLSASAKRDGGAKARTRATMFLDSTNRKLFICGGVGNNSIPLSDLVEYNIALNKWSRITDQINKVCSESYESAQSCIYGFTDSDFSLVYCFPSLSHHSSGSDPALVWYFKRLTSFDSSQPEHDVSRENKAFVVDTRTKEREEMEWKSDLLCSATVFNPLTQSFYIIAQETSSSSSGEKALYQFDINKEKISFLANVPFTGRALFWVEQTTGDLFCAADLETSVQFAIDKRANNSGQQFWHYQSKSTSWRLIGKSEADMSISPRKNAGFVFDTLRKVFYMFGGNESDKSMKGSTPLGELFSGQVEIPTTAEVLRKCLWNVHINHILDLLSKEGRCKLQALAKIQQLTKQFPQPKQQREIRNLSQFLFKPMVEVDHTTRLKRLFDHLCSHFPKNMQPPAENLIDVVSHHQFNWSFEQQEHDISD